MHSTVCLCGVGKNPEQIESEWVSINNDESQCLKSAVTYWSSNYYSDWKKPCIPKNVGQKIAIEYEQLGLNKPKMGESGTLKKATLEIIVFLPQWCEYVNVIVYVHFAPVRASSLGRCDFWRGDDGMVQIKNLRVYTERKMLFFKYCCKTLKRSEIVHTRR